MQDNTPTQDKLFMFNSKSVMHLYTDFHKRLYKSFEKALDEGGHFESIKMKEDFYKHLMPINVFNELLNFSPFRIVTPPGQEAYVEYYSPLIFANTFAQSSKVKAEPAVTTLEVLQSVEIQKNVTNSMKATWGLNDDKIVTKQIEIANANTAIGSFMAALIFDTDAFVAYYLHEVVAPVWNTLSVPIGMPALVNMTNSTKRTLAQYVKSQFSFSYNNMLLPTGMFLCQNPSKSLFMKAFAQNDTKMDAVPYLIQEAFKTYFPDKLAIGDIKLFSEIIEDSPVPFRASVSLKGISEDILNFFGAVATNNTLSDAFDEVSYARYSESSVCLKSMTFPIGTRVKINPKVLRLAKDFYFCLDLGTTIVSDYPRESIKLIKQGKKNIFSSSKNFLAFNAQSFTQDATHFGRVFTEENMQNMTGTIQEFDISYYTKTISTFIRSGGLFHQITVSLDRPIYLKTNTSPYYTLVSNIDFNVSELEVIPNYLTNPYSPNISTYSHTGLTNPLHALKAPYAVGSSPNLTAGLKEKGGANTVKHTKNAANHLVNVGVDALKPLSNYNLSRSHTRTMTNEPASKIKTGMRIGDWCVFSVPTSDKRSCSIGDLNSTGSVVTSDIEVLPKLQHFYQKSNKVVIGQLKEVTSQNKFKTTTGDLFENCRPLDQRDLQELFKQIKNTRVI